MFDNGKEVAPYTKIQCAWFKSKKGKKTSLNACRLRGPLLRHKIFRAAAPDNGRRVYLGNDRDELLDILPDPDVRLAKRPPDIPLLLNLSTPSPYCP